MKNRNLKLKVMVAVAIAVSIGMAPMSGAIAEASTIKAKSNVNVRTAASSSSEKIDYVNAGEIANYLGTVNGWAKIEFNGKIGFSSETYWTGNTATATGNVNIRSLANSSSQKVGYAVAQTEVKVLGRCGTWLYVDMDGVRGFSSKSYYDISDTLFYSLPYVASGVNLPTPPVVTTPAPSTINAGDVYKLNVNVPGYLNVIDAKAGSNAINTMNSGTYYVYKVYDVNSISSIRVQEETI